MIFEAITGVALVIFNGIVSWFPAIDLTVQSNIDTFYSNARSTLGTIGWIFPTDTFFQLFGYILLIELSVLTFKVVRWVLNLLSGGIVKA